MNFYSLNPLICVGKINIGASRSETRSAMGAYTEFKKNKFSKNTTDDFGSCHVFYDKDNNVEAVEVFKESILEYKKKNLFLLNKESIISLFNVRDAKYESNTLSMPEIGIEISFDEGCVDSILVTRLGY